MSLDKFHLGTRGSECLQQKTMRDCYEYLWIPHTNDFWAAHPFYVSIQVLSLIPSYPKEEPSVGTAPEALRQRELGFVELYKQLSGLENQTYKRNVSPEF